MSTPAIPGYVAGSATVHALRRRRTVRVTFTRADGTRTIPRTVDTADFGGIAELMDAAHRRVKSRGWRGYSVDFTS